MKVTLENVGRVCKAYDEKFNLLGTCSFVVSQMSYYNSVEDNWTCNLVDVKEWLISSLKNKYGEIEICE